VKTQIDERANIGDLNLVLTGRPQGPWLA